MRFEKIRLELIRMLAGNYPILLNWDIKSAPLKMNSIAVYVPGGAFNIEVARRSVLTPRNHSNSAYFG